VSIEVKERLERGLPCLSDVDHVDAIRTSLPQIWLHVYLQVLRAEMALSGEEHFDILCSSIEACWEICRHDCGRVGTCWRIKYWLSAWTWILFL
jgi:hypothetical protein